MLGTKSKAARRGGRKFKIWSLITFAAHWVRNNQNSLKRRKTEKLAYKALTEKKRNMYGV